jgi:hypothetical protein
MTNHALVVIHDEKARQRVLDCIRGAAIGSRVDIKGPKRTLPQNARMWAMLTDIVKQKKTINGQQFTIDEYKVIFLHALGQEQDILPTLDGRNFFSTGYSSSKTTKVEMSNLIELIFAWGAENGVVWSDPQLASYEEMRRT